MAYKTMKCPSCGAILTNVDPNMKQFYCMYCGTSIINDDTNHYTIDINKTYRTIDEARIKEVDVEREIRLKELEHKQKKELNQKKSDKWWAIGLILFIVFLIITVLLLDKKAKSEGQILLRAGRKDLIGENYLVVESIIKDAGFTNIELIDLNDADKTNAIEKSVASISIGGDLDWNGYNYYPPDRLVIISYH